MRQAITIGGFLLLALTLELPARVCAQQASQQASQETRFEQFKKTMNNAKLVGRFTVSGQKDEKFTAEEYHVLGVEKMDEGDFWMIKARVKYGERDVTVPMALEVKWAGNTPVISLDQVEIPVLGRFSAHVVIDGNKYAGTWSHDDVGGHLFGYIEPLQSAAEKSGGGDKSKE
jgi:hypothetical protein